MRTINLFLSACVVAAPLLLAGCGGGSPSSSTTPPQNSFPLTVTAPPAGQGTITSSPSGINCPGTCNASFAQNTKVTLTATPASNFYFGGWTGGCTGTSACTLTITAATTVSATFNPGIGVTVSLAGAGSGTVTSTPAGINCSTSSTATCSAGFSPNSQITLTETPSTNNLFAGWSGACTGTAACTLTLTASSNVTATFGGTMQSSINHIILFAQENRSFDHYFGYMRQYWANHGITDQSFDGLPQFNPVSGIAPLQGPVPSIPGCTLSSDVTGCTPDPTNMISSFAFDSILLPSGKTGTVCEENQSPFWNEAHNDWDYANPSDQPAEVGSNGLPDPPLNGFVFTAAYDARSNSFMDVNGNRAMGYFTDAELNLDYALATAFGTSDRWFSPVMDRTQLNRAYIYAATSDGYAYPPGSDSADNAPLPSKTIFEELQDAGVSWKIYIDPTNVTYNNVNCDTAAAGQVQDMCLAGASYMNQFVYEAQVQNAATNLWQHFAPISQFGIDLKDDATFPAYAMIEPASSAGLDEHPSDTDISPVNVQLGEQFMQNAVLAPLLTSPTWTDSALIITYDEAGGLYDHVAPQPAPAPGDHNNPIDLQPPQNGNSGDICKNPGQTLGQGTCTFGWTGYRVPLLVISPYAKQNFVSHTQRDTTAVLKMVETRFEVPSLTLRDASEASMDEFFDYVNKPYATPPTLPTQVTGANCDQTPPAVWNEPPEVTVTISGGGNVSSSPASGIGSTATNNACTTECTGVFATTTVVTLTAAPNTGSTFTGWSGACTGTTPTCTVTVGTGQQMTTATFNP